MTQLKKEKSDLDKRSEKLKKKVNNILQKDTSVEETGDEPIMVKIKNRSPKDVAEIQAEFNAISDIVELRSDIKENEELLARLIGELAGQKESKEPLQTEDAKPIETEQSMIEEDNGDAETTVDLSDRIDLLKRHNKEFETEIKLLKK